MQHPRDWLSFHHSGGYQNYSNMFNDSLLDGNEAAIVDAELFNLASRADKPDLVDAGAFVAMWIGAMGACLQRA